VQGSDVKVASATLDVALGTLGAAMAPARRRKALFVPAPAEEWRSYFGRRRYAD
jgi:hypothetical protein